MDELLLARSYTLLRQSPQSLSFAHRDTIVILPTTDQPAMQCVNTHLATFYNLLASITVVDERSSSGVQINSGLGELPNINQEEDVITTAIFKI